MFGLGGQGRGDLFNLTHDVLFGHGHLAPVLGDGSHQLEKPLVVHEGCGAVREGLLVRVRGGADWLGGGGGGIANMAEHELM